MAYTSSGEERRREKRVEAPFYIKLGFKASAFGFALELFQPGTRRKKIRGRTYFYDTRSLH
jgi:hypothetical protein